jgi:hypothetical protein
MSGAKRGTTESTVSDRLTDPLQAIVESNLDLDATIWLPESDTAECYHEDCAWGPGCPEHIGKLVESTLRDAVICGLRPCTQCNPVDYRESGGASL